MVEPSNFYSRLATREGFNASVRHINTTLDLLDSCGSRKNLADEVNRLLVAKEIEQDEVQSSIHMLLVEKWKYRVLSRNLASVTAHAELVPVEAARWKAVDLVVAYHHPDLGFVVFNPKNPSSAPLIADFRKSELVVLYAGNPSTPISDSLANEALGLLLAAIEARPAKASAAMLRGPFSFVPPRKPASAAPARKAPKAAPKQAATTGAAAASAKPDYLVPHPQTIASSGPSKMSARVSVSVTNELFHNGNVEAWKRIIRAYNAKYPTLQVIVYYDGERIADINTLFKWGKVKHGSCIQFAVAGDNIQDLAKLSRYFRQGASPQFEAFLRGSPDTVLNLF